MFSLSGFINSINSESSLPLRAGKNSLIKSVGDLIIAVVVVIVIIGSICGDVCVVD